MLATVIVVVAEEDWTEDAGGVVPVLFDSDAAASLVSLEQNNYLKYRNFSNKVYIYI